MSDSKVFMFPESGHSNSDLMSIIGPLLSQRGLDPNLLLTMNRNNGPFGNDGSWFIWILFLFMFGGWGNGFGRNREAMAGDAYLSNLINNDQGRELLMSAIQGNGTAINQLASTLNCAVGTLQGDINGIKCKLPDTTTIQYSPVVGVPQCVAAQYGFGYGNPYANGFWG